LFFLIGHRGVGKTSITNLIPGGLDLDVEISKSHNISDFFENDDEASFRDLERTILKKALNSKSKPAVISLGAGFELEKFRFPKQSKFVWIQRLSDVEGRVFENRPRLNTKFSPLEEYFERFEQRNKMYADFADMSLELTEGAHQTEALIALNKWILGQTVHQENAYYTLRSRKDLDFVSGKIELRTDLIDVAEIPKILKDFSSNEYVVSLRSDVDEVFIKNLLNNQVCSIDLPMEQSSLLKALTENIDLKQALLRRAYFSLHSKLSQAALDTIALVPLHLKWSPEISNFRELKQALKSVSALDVSFLPRDPKGQGRWKWLRESFFTTNKINFYRFGRTEHLDQPSALNLKLSNLDATSSKGAVLGENVFLSHSPGYHRSFFRSQFDSFYSSIAIERDEFTLENFDLIKSLGYCFFSVTSPFKNKLSFLGIEDVTNTLVCSDDKLAIGANTDESALKNILETFKNEKKIMIWGSGAMGQTISSLFEKRAVLKSVRSYKGEEMEPCGLLIWCAGVHSPQPKFREAPLKVLDLEYKEHSRAKIFAVENGASYKSGEEFFKSQALAQQVFWKKMNEEKI